MSENPCVFAWFQGAKSFCYKPLLACLLVHFSLIAFRYRVLQEVKRVPHSVSTGTPGHHRAGMPQRALVDSTREPILRTRSGSSEIPALTPIPVGSWGSTRGLTKKLFIRGSGMQRDLRASIIRGSGIKRDLRASTIRGSGIKRDLNQPKPRNLRVGG